MSTTESFSSHCEVAFVAQLLRNGAKGHALLSLFSDGLIEEQLVFRVMIAGEGRRMTGEGEVES